MPISTDISDLWWLRQEKPESSVPAMQLGAQIAQRKADSIREAEQAKTSTAMRMMDLMMERDRNDLALKTFNTKQEADLLRVKGMSEIGAYIGDAVKNNKLTDPEAQAGFWNLTSRYAPFIDNQTVNSMWDNTFKSAMDRKDRAKGRGANSTITERDVALISDLRQKERDLIEQRKTAVSDEHLADIDTNLRDVREDMNAAKQMKGVVDAGSKPRIETIPDATGESVKILVGSNGKTIKVLPKVDTSKLSQVESVLLKKEAQAIDPESIRYFKKDKDGKFAFDEEQYKDDLKALEEKYTKKKPSAPGASPTASDPLGIFK